MLLCTLNESKGIIFYGLGFLAYFPKVLGGGLYYICQSDVKNAHNILVNISLL